MHNHLSSVANTARKNHYIKSRSIIKSSKNAKQHNNSKLLFNSVLISSNNVLYPKAENAQVNKNEKNVMQKCERVLQSVAESSTTITADNIKNNNFTSPNINNLSVNCTQNTTTFVDDVGRRKPARQRFVHFVEEVFVIILF